MVERSAGMAFAAGALVFPGGRIDEADRTLGLSLGVDGAPGLFELIATWLARTLGT